MSLCWDKLAASGKMRRSLRFAGPPRRLSPNELRVVSVESRARVKSDGQERPSHTGWGIR